MRDTHDVIIVGGGMAGLSAALAAGEAGADVLVLESEPVVGGSMALSGGLIWGAATYELARQWVPRGHPELPRMLVDELEPAWDWLEGQRLPLDPAVPCLKDRMGRGRLMAAGGPGARGPWAELLLAAARREGAEVVVDARVETATRGEDGWTVTYTRNDATHTATAASVIFCGGGFQNSAELVRR